MKKFLSLMLVICMMSILIAAMPITTSAASSGTCGDNLTWTLDDEGTLTISGTGAMYDWSSPSIPWYSSCSLVKKVVISDGVTSIGGCAFSGCTSLTDITIPNSVTSIVDGAFSGCTSLTDITIPSNVTSIGFCAFYNCASLTDITIPNGVTSIGERAFFGCTSLSSIVVDGNNQNYSSVDGNLFNKDKTILIQYAIGKIASSYIIPNGVTSIGDSAFCYCKSLTYITIPSSVTSIGDHAFYFCETLSDITISNSVTSIGHAAFCYCKSLTYIAIPSSVTSIGDHAFRYCTSLTDITVPNGVTSIGEYVFDGCTRLSSITIPSSVTSIGSDAFNSCTRLSSITIPNSVTSIGEYAFIDCTSLTDITIPSSVTSIGDSAFSRCTSLSSILVDDNNQNYSSVDGNLFNKDKTILIQYAIGKTASSYIIPNGVTSIGSGAFEDCTSLTDITISNSVTSIGAYAFNNCASLTDVYYSGTEAEWNEISIATGNTYLTDANVHFVACTKTTLSNNDKTFTINPINIEIGKTVILALYEGDKFVGMQKATYEGEAIPFTTTKSYTNAKVFVWNTLATLVPVSKAEIVK